MTIKIEREALQCITNDTSECILPSLEEQPVDRLPELSFNKGLDYPELDLTECDDSSVSSYSFTSSTAERTVSWATPLVVEVRTRPRTKAMDVRQLFYSYEETQRFRHEYRLERRRAAEEEAAINDASAIGGNAQNVTDILSSANSGSSGSGFSGFNTATNAMAQGNCVSNTCSRASGKHRISRVVVMHKNKLTTFVDHQEQHHSVSSRLHPDHATPSDISEASPASLTESTMSISDAYEPPATVSSDPKATSNDFFDNDNFWSGQITWY